MQRASGIVRRPSSPGETSPEDRSPSPHGPSEGSKVKEPKQLGLVFYEKIQVAQRRPAFGGGSPCFATSWEPDEHVKRLMDQVLYQPSQIFHSNFCDVATALWTF